MMNRIYLLLFAAVVSLTSCVMDGEDTNCTDDLRIYFSVAPQIRATRTIEASDLTELNLFAFDKDGYFLGVWRDENVVLTPDYYMSIPLGVGLYTFVAWGNLRGCYKTVPTNFEIGVTKLSEAILALDNTGGIVTVTPHTLIFGNLPNTNVEGVGNQYFTIPLVNDTYKITVKTEGLPVLGDAFSLTITDKNGNLNFDNSIAASSELTHTTICTLDQSSQPTGTLSTLRLSEDPGRPVSTLILKNETIPQELFRGDLIQQILQLRSIGQQVDFKTMNEFTIILSFDVNLNVTITINGWNVPIHQEEVINPE